MAKTLVKYSERHAELDLAAFTIPQIPGAQGPSKPARGVSEALVRKVMYVVPLVMVQPWIPAALATGYFAAGRFNPNHYPAAVYDPARVEAWASATPFSQMASADQRTR